MAAFAVMGALPISSGSVCGGDHRSPPLRNLGSGEYCVKGGSSNSKGCNGYLATGSFNQVRSVVNSSGACGLSHWSFDGDDKETPRPTATPDPTATRRPRPTATPDPTATSRPGPTATPDPTATDTPDPTRSPSETPTATNAPPTDPPPTDRPQPSDTPQPNPSDTPRPKSFPSKTPTRYSTEIATLTPTATATVGCACCCQDYNGELWTYIHIDDEARAQLESAIAWGNESLVEAIDRSNVSFSVETELKPILYALVAIFAVLGGNLILGLYNSFKK